MNVAKTITEAAKIFGSQKALAAALGEKESSLSAFKKGRPISYQKHAQIAAMAGMQEEARHIIIQGMAETLRDDVEHEAQAKAALLAMLAAFPLEQPTPESVMKVNSWSRCQRSRYLRNTGYRPVFFRPLRSPTRRRTTIKLTPN